MQPVPPFHEGIRHLRFLAHSQLSGNKKRRMLQQLALHAPFQHEKNAQKGKGKSSHGNYQEQHCMFFSGLPARRQVQKRLKQVLLRDKKFNFKSYVQNYYVKCITFCRLHLIQNQIKSHKIQSLVISFYLWIHSRCIRLILQNTCIHHRGTGTTLMFPHTMTFRQK